MFSPMRHRWVANLREVWRGRDLLGVNCRHEGHLEVSYEVTSGLMGTFRCWRPGWLLYFAAVHQLAILKRSLVLDLMFAFG